MRPQAGTVQDCYRSCKLYYTITPNATPFRGAAQDAALDLEDPPVPTRSSTRARQHGRECGMDHPVNERSELHINHLDFIPDICLKANHGLQATEALACSRRYHVRREMPSSFHGSPSTAFGRPSFFSWRVRTACWRFSMPASAALRSALEKVGLFSRSAANRLAVSGGPKLGNGDSNGFFTMAQKSQNLAQNATDFCATLGSYNVRAALCCGHEVEEKDLRCFT